ncbi:glycosyltransferase [Actinomadura craniellae]|uniref:glycosyltransferase n=1 Tax=Actinomadura craniellae TaxID=2231787 RepID=UPI001F21D7E4|nr:glycosyltransferase family 2 protein [Actinomadura craniellae]
MLTQTRPAQRLVAVDTGSHDRGPAVLTEVVGEGKLLRLPRTTGYGEAVAEALRHPAAHTPVAPTEDGSAPTEWIWLLHDDSAPAQDALELLLRVAGTDPNIGLLGPKLRDWTDRRRLLELGVTLDGAGRRDTGIDRHEFDQGQHDGVRDVLAVSTAGMLVRRDVWEQVGGFDLDFGLFRDDVDFGWRVHAAGHRVVAASDAVVFHAEAAARGAREIGMTTESARRRDRRNVLYTLLANQPLRPMLRSLARNATVALLRAVTLLAAKRPAAARDELGAFADVIRSPDRLRRARAARAAGRTHVYRSVRRFLPRRVALRRAVERFSTALATERRPGPTVEVRWRSARRRVLSNPGVLLVAALAVVALVAERSVLLAAGRLGGGALVPAPGGAGDLWAQYAAGWHPAGLGSDAGSPPYVGVLAALSTVTFGKPWLAVSLLLLASVPLAGLTAYLASGLVVTEPPRTGRRARAARRLVPAPVLRAWIAVTYALLPVATGTIAAGRLGTAVVFVLTPLLGLLVARIYGLPRLADPAARRLRARRAAWGTALLLTVTMAFVPLTWLLALIAGLLGRFAFGAARRGADRDLVVALSLPPLLLLPWTLGLLRHPSRFLLEAGLHRPELVDAAPAAGALLMLDPGGPGTPPHWVLYGLLAVAVLALPLRSRRTTVMTGWMLALFGLLVAILVSAVQVTSVADRSSAWPGVPLLVAALGVLLAATAVVQRAAEALAGKHLLYRPAGAAVLALAVSAPLLAAGHWVVTGVRGPLGEVDPDSVPSFLGAGPTGARTLVLGTERTGRVSYSVLRGAEPRLGEADTPADTTARHRMDGLVARLAAGHADAPALTRMGVRYFLVPRPAADPMTSVLDGAPGVTRLSRTTEWGVWRLVTPGGRLMLLDGPTITPLPAGRTDAAAVVPPGRDGRVLLLAEPADGGWRATLNGARPAARTVDGWAQGYAVPAAGGRFELTRSMRGRHLWVTIQAAALLVVAALALPGGRPDGRTGSQTVERGPGRNAHRGLRRRPRRAHTAEPAESVEADELTASGEHAARTSGRHAVPAGSGEHIARTSGRHALPSMSGEHVVPDVSGEQPVVSGSGEHAARTSGRHAVPGMSGEHVVPDVSGEQPVVSGSGEHAARTSGRHALPGMSGEHVVPDVTGEQPVVNASGEYAARTSGEEAELPGDSTTTGSGAFAVPEAAGGEERRRSGPGRRRKTGSGARRIRFRSPAEIRFGRPASGAEPAPAGPDPVPPAPRRGEEAGTAEPPGAAESSGDAVATGGEPGNERGDE